MYRIVEVKSNTGIIKGYLLNDTSAYKLVFCPIGLNSGFTANSMMICKYDENEMLVCNINQYINLTNLQVKDISKFLSEIEEETNKVKKLEVLENNPVVVEYKKLKGIK